MFVQPAVALMALLMRPLHVPAAMPAAVSMSMAVTRPQRAPMSGSPVSGSPVSGPPWTRRPGTRSPWTRRPRNRSPWTRLPLSGALPRQNARYRYDCALPSAAAASFGRICLSNSRLFRPKRISPVSMRHASSQTPSSYQLGIHPAAYYAASAYLVNPGD